MRYTFDSFRDRSFLSDGMDTSLELCEVFDERVDSLEIIGDRLEREGDQVVCLHFFVGGDSSSHMIYNGNK